jgi:hypothetical protein
VSFNVTEPPGSADEGPESAVAERSASREKFAVHATSEVICTLPSAQSAAPVHPVNVEPAAAAALSATVAPSEKVAEQEAPQSIPAGELVTVPDPPPAFVTVSVRLVELQEFPPSP